MIKGLIPRRRAPLGKVECLGALAGFLAFAPDQGGKNALGMIDEVISEAAFDAQVAMVDRRVKW